MYQQHDSEHYLADSAILVVVQEAKQNNGLFLVLHSHTLIVANLKKTKLGTDSIARETVSSWLELTG